MANAEPAVDVAAKIAELTLSEKVEMLSGSIDFWPGLYGLAQKDLYHKQAFPAAANERVGIPGLRFIDGPRGVVIFGGATTFPVTMARGATWNPELEGQIGDALGTELRLLGGNLTGAVCINLLRHPAWGRAQETYGEDTHHLASMGAALTEGIQRHAIACVKHFALNSMENARFSVDVTIDDRSLHEVYLPHFKACVDAGAMSIMSAYNSVNGQWAGQNKTLLTDILKDRWGFRGFVLTDFIFGARDGEQAIRNGLDLEMPFPIVWGPKLKALVASGVVDESLLDRAIERVVTPQFELPPIEDYPSGALGCDAHRQLAREAATQSIVLLKNGALKSGGLEDGGLEDDNQAGRPVLPLPADAGIVVLGQLAATAVLGDRGSSDGRPTYAVSALEGLRHGGRGSVEHFASLGDDGAEAAVDRADAVVVVVGNTHLDEGEYVAPISDLGELPRLAPVPPQLRRLFDNRILGPRWPGLVAKLLGLVARREAKQMEAGTAAFGIGGDRTNLGLKAEDEDLIAEACDRHDRVIVALVGGSAIMMENWRHRPGAILLFWYAGQEGGNALADIVFGRRSPSGRLPFSIPTDTAHLPHFDKDATSITYDLWHGYRKLDRDGVAPAFPFGFGLGYTTFEIGALRADRPSYTSTDTVQLAATVANTGTMPGATVVQLYAEVPQSSVERAGRELKGFQRVELEPGTERDVTIEMPIERLAYFDVDADDFVVEATTYHLVAAQHVADDSAVVCSIEVT